MDKNTLHYLGTEALILLTEGITIDTVMAKKFKESDLHDSNKVYVKGTCHFDISAELTIREKSLWGQALKEQLIIPMVFAMADKINNLKKRKYLVFPLPISEKNKWGITIHNTKMNVRLIKHRRNGRNILSMDVALKEII